MKQEFFRIFFSSLKYTKTHIDNSDEETENFFKVLQKGLQKLQTLDLSAVIFPSILRSKEIELISDKRKMQFMDLEA